MNFLQGGESKNQCTRYDMHIILGKHLNTMENQVGTNHGSYTNNGTQSLARRKFQHRNIDEKDLFSQEYES